MNLDAVYSAFQKYYSSSLTASKFIMDEFNTNTSSTSSIEGLGVGLNVAYNMIQMMGGTLECSATDTESKFWFGLDLSFETGSENSSDSDSVQLQQLNSRRLQNSNIMDQPSKWTTVQESAIAQQYVRYDENNEVEDLNGGVNLSAFKQARRVLIVDDSTICQRVLVKLLKRLGLDSDVATNGKEAIDKLSTVPLIFDAIIMDLQMPVMDGQTAIKKCRSELNLTIPIIVLTADCSEEARPQVIMGLGASAYLNKPATLNDIKLALRKFELC